ncbi:MAG: hypothetical protein AB4080_05290 [Trichodesmium sp.]
MEFYRKYSEKLSLEPTSPTLTQILTFWARAAQNLLFFLDLKMLKPLAANTFIFNQQTLSRPIKAMTED